MTSFNRNEMPQKMNLFDEDTKKDTEFSSLLKSLDNLNLHTVLLGLSKAAIS